MQIVGVKFKSVGEVVYFNAQNYKLKKLKKLLKKTLKKQIKIMK